MKNKIYLYLPIPFAVSLIALFLPSLTIISPIPMVVGFPLLLVSNFGFFAILLTLVALNVVTYFFLNYDLIKGKGYEKIFKRLPIVMITLMVLSIIYFTFSWEYAIDFQGFSHTMILIFINLLFILAFWSVWFLSRKHRTYAKALILNLILQIWLFWYAFPWLGEGI